MKKFCDQGLAAWGPRKLHSTKPLVHYYKLCDHNVCLKGCMFL